MKFSHLFTGKPYHEIEKNADALFQMGEYGSAKFEYEKALLKLQKKIPEAHEARDQIEAKIVKSKDALALEHRKTAENLTEAGIYEEAEDLLQLALELVQNKQLAVEIEKQLRNLKARPIQRERSDTSDPAEALDDTREFAYEESEVEFFTALINTLPEEEQEIYLRYGDVFRDGYVKLNQGFFEEAVALLSRALETNAGNKGFIQLELATAHLNLGNDAEGCSLLESFLREHPESLRAYPPLCEIYWQNKQFDAAQHLLMNCPKTFQNSPVIQLLLGETLFHAGRFQDAQSHYLDYLDAHGRNEAIVLALAKTYEALGAKEKARKQYAEIINNCQSCRTRIDPHVKQKYADISLETGDHSTSILELYLSLVQEIPENRTEYYQKISTIYELNGNDNEARRFRSFAEQSQRKPPVSDDHL